jgi:hypothetical protein
MADIETRQLILAKVIDNLGTHLGFVNRYPFVLQPTVTSGALTANLPAQLIWDMSAIILDTWSNFRLAFVERRSGVNGGAGSSGYTGVLRFYFSANDADSIATEKALFYADYTLDSANTYQIVALAVPVLSGSPLPIPDADISALQAGYIIFKTGDQSDTTITTFYDFVRPGSGATALYPVGNQVGTESERYSATSVVHGKGLLTSSAYVVTPSAGASGNLVSASDGTILVTYIGGSYVIRVVPASIDHNQLLNRGTNTHGQIDLHLSSTSNPHSTSGAQLIKSDGISTGGNSEAIWNAYWLRGTNISDLSGVNAPLSGQMLVWDAAGTQWIAGGADHSRLSNVGIYSHSQIDTHIQSDGVGTHAANPHRVTGAQIITTAGAAGGNAEAIWNANKIYNASVASTVPVSGQGLMYDGTNWTPDYPYIKHIYERPVQFDQWWAHDAAYAAYWSNPDAGLNHGEFSNASTAEKSLPWGAAAPSPYNTGYDATATTGTWIVRFWVEGVLNGNWTTWAVLRVVLNGTTLVRKMLCGSSIGGSGSSMTWGYMFTERVYVQPTGTYANKLHWDIYVDTDMSNPSVLLARSYAKLWSFDIMAERVSGLP